eukprot:gene15384-biopygen7084
MVFRGSRRCKTQCLGGSGSDGGIDHARDGCPFSNADTEKGRTWEGRRNFPCAPFGAPRKPRRGRPTDARRAHPPPAAPARPPHRLHGEPDEEVGEGEASLWLLVTRLPGPDSIQNLKLRDRNAARQPSAAEGPFRSSRPAPRLGFPQVLVWENPGPEPVSETGLRTVGNQGCAWPRELRTVLATRFRGVENQALPAAERRMGGGAAGRAFASSGRPARATPGGPAPLERDTHQLHTHLSTSRPSPLPLSTSRPSPLRPEPVPTRTFAQSPLVPNRIAITPHWHTHHRHDPAPAPRLPAAACVLGATGRRQKGTAGLRAIREKVRTPAIYKVPIGGRAVGRPRVGEEGAAHGSSSSPVEPPEVTRNVEMRRARVRSGEFLGGRLVAPVRGHRPVKNSDSKRPQVEPSANGINPGGSREGIPWVKCIDLTKAVHEGPPGDGSANLRLILIVL